MSHSVPNGSPLPTLRPPEGRKKSARGFAGMPPERQREIASLGGKAAHKNKNAHEFTSETGRAASLKRKKLQPKPAEP
jgi:uncharacterized protein